MVILSRPAADVNARPPSIDTVGARRYDDAVMGAEPPVRVPRCPTCRGPAVWTGNPHRPFCSLSCRLIDLGVWLDERYRIAGPELSAESVPEDEPRPRETG